VWWVLCLHHGIQTGVEFDEDDWETSSLQDEDDERDPVTVGYVEGREVSVLRDTGAINCCLVRKDLVPPGKFTGKTKWLKFADTKKRTEVPMAKVQVDTPYFRGELEAACVNSPMFDLMIGNVKGARKPDDPDPEWRTAPIQQKAEEEDPLPCEESQGEDDIHGGVVCQPEAMLESVAAEEEDPLPFPEADIVDWFHGGASGESMPCGDRVTLRQPREVTRTATKGEQLLRDDGGDNGLSMAPTGSQQSDNGASEGLPRRLVMCNAFAPLPVSTDVQGEVRASTAPPRPDTGQIDGGIAPADLQGRPEAMMLQHSAGWTSSTVSSGHPGSLGPMTTDHRVTGDDDGRNHRTLAPRSSLLRPPEKRGHRDCGQQGRGAPARKGHYAVSDRGPPPGVLTWMSEDCDSE
jgi:hypothetical protein